MRKTIFLLLITSLIEFPASGQELARSGSFGALVGDLNDSTQTVLKLPSSKGTLIKRVVGGSSADKAGLIINDVVVSFDGKAINNTNQFLSILKEYKGGDKIKVGYYRQGKLKTTAITLQPKPKETSKDYDVIYSSVYSGNNHLRTIITKPKGDGIYPAVLIIGGVGCYSIDNVSGKYLLSTKMWIDSLTLNGFVTIRVEKTGIGDSKGVPCSECDFITEKQGYWDGLKQLKSLSYVDKENVFIAGFSMGGVIAPLIAQQKNVKGIVVYGTVGRNWLEYELENTHRQKLLEDYPADSLDFLMRAEYKRLYGLLVEKKTPEQIINEHPETVPTFFNYPMGIKYFQQVADVNVRQSWMNTDAYVLVMHGTSDFVSSANEHELISQTVNRYHPNKATHIEIENADHWGLYAESEKISKSHTQTEVSPLVVTTAVSWLLKNSASTEKQNYFIGTVEYNYAYESDNLNIDSLTKAKFYKSIFRYDNNNYQSKFIGSDTITYNYLSDLSKCISETNSNKNYDCEDYSILTDSILSYKIYPTNEKVLGYDCKIIEVQSKYFWTKYFVSVDLLMNPITYQNHYAYNWKHLNEKINGGLILKLEHRFKNYTMKGIATKVRQENIDFRATQLNEDIISKVCKS